MKRFKEKRINQPSMSQKIFLKLFFAIFLIYGITLAYPFVWAMINAGKTGMEYVNDSFGLAESYVWRNFIDAFTNIKHNNVDFFHMFFNSIWMSILCVFANVGASSLVAYVMAKYHFPGKTALYAVAIFIQVVPIVGAGASKYKFLSETGLLDNPTLFWLTWAAGFDFAFVVLYGYFRSVSWEYAEAAFMDGASDFRVFLRVMMPQARGAIASLMILNFITAWNDYNTPLLYMKSYPTMALGIYMFQEESRFMANSMPLLFAAVIIATIPVIIIFACTQDMIMTNVTAGGLKG